MYSLTEMGLLFLCLFRQIMSFLKIQVRTNTFLSFRRSLNMETTTMNNKKKEGAVMHIFKSVPVFFIFLFLGIQFPYTAVQAWDCCPCGPKRCMPGCVCRGTGHCYWCRGDDPGEFQSNTSMHESNLDVNRLGQASIGFTSFSVTERIIELLRGGKRLILNFGLNQLANIQDTPKLGCLSNENNVSALKLLK